MSRLFLTEKSRSYKGGRKSASRTGFLTPRQAGEFFGIHPATLNTWRKRGRGPRYFKFGPLNRNGTVRYRLADLEAFVASHVVEPGKDR